MNKWLLIFFALFISIQPAYATEPQSLDKQENSFKPPRTLDLYAEPIYYVPFVSWADSVTMTKLPPGSLRVRYDGPRKLIFKQVQNQVRRAVRKYESPSEPRHRLDKWQIPNPDQWWSRSWMHSLPESKGGAPETTYTHTVGSESSWSLGPLTITNTLKFSLDYIAAFKLNTDPTSPQGNPQRSALAVDVYGPDDTYIEASSNLAFKFKIKPNIRIGLLRNGDWFSFLRNISIRMELDVIAWGQRILRIEGEIRYKRRRGVRIKLSIALVRW